MPRTDLTSTRTPATIAEVESSIADVRVFHARGVEDEKAGRQFRRPGTVSQKKNMAQARAFSRLYSQAELDRVLNRCRAAGWVLSVTHFLKLMTVPKDQYRDELQERAIRERWSTPQLTRVVRAMLGNRRPGSGRNPKVASFSDGLVQLARLAEQWRKLRAQIDRQPRPGTNAGRKSPAPPALTKKLLAVDTSLEELIKHINRVQGPKPGE
jgi:hypothetical protein